jgi:hypothetical protein
MIAVCSMRKVLCSIRATENAWDRHEHKNCIKGVAHCELRVAFAHTFLQTSNLCLKIIALLPGLELRANSTKARGLHSGDFTAFAMNIEHLTMPYTMRKKTNEKR